MAVPGRPRTGAGSDPQAASGDGDDPAACWRDPDAGGPLAAPSPAPRSRSA